MSSLLLNGAAPAAAQGDIQYASLEPQNMIDINVSPTIDVLWTVGSLDTNIPGLTAIATGFNNIPAGVYLVTMHLRYVLTVATGNDVTVRFRVAVNGVQGVIIAENGYISGVGGNLQGSASTAGIITVPAAGTVGVTALQGGDPGDVNLAASTGQMGLVRLTQ